MILYQGPSVLDGAPIVAIATGYGAKSKNRKTGALVQIWIMRADVEPHQAVKTGDDESICGNCPHRHFLGGDCYVLPFQAPLSIYRAFVRGSYASLDADPGFLSGEKVRVGAYGDPAAVPFEVWETVLSGAAEIVSYTHQYRHPNFDKRVLSFSQFSADSLPEARRAWKRGQKTFRVVSDYAEKQENEIVCPAESGTSCADCMACTGSDLNIVIKAHGARAKRAA